MLLHYYSFFLSTVHKQVKNVFVVSKHDLKDNFTYLKIL